MESHIEKIINENLANFEYEERLRKSIQKMEDAAGKQAFNKAAKDTLDYADEIVRSDGEFMPLREADQLREWLVELVKSLRQKFK